MTSQPSLPRRRVVAAFDVDGTLTRRDTLLPFLAFVCGRKAVTASLLRRSARLGLSVAPGPGNAGGAVRGARHDGRGRVKECVLQDLLAGRRDDDVREAGERFAGRLATASWLRPDMVTRWRWHRAHGHELVIVSASLEAYLVPFARLLGGAEVLATRLGVDGGGRLTGSLEGVNCRGAEKVVRLRTWGLGPPLEGAQAVPSERPLGDGIELWAYGDSSGDRELLAAAQMAHRVRRRRQLPVRPARERSR